MRLSIRMDDPSYNKYLAFNCTVLVDGVDVTGKCHTADEEKGVAWCYKHNEEGKPYVDPCNPGKVAEEELTGKVEIIVHEHNGVAT